MKISHGSLVVEAELPLVDRSMHVAVKRLRPKTVWKALAYLFRRGRAPEAWYRGHALLARGISTARPLVVYQPAGGTLFREGFLLTQWLTVRKTCTFTAGNWRRAMNGFAVVAPSNRPRCSASSSVGCTTKVSAHRDLKGNNLLLRERADDVEAFLIDLDGLRQLRRVPFNICVKGLTRLAVSAKLHPWISRTDHLRFLLRYLREMPENRRTWKTWWRAVNRSLEESLAEIRVAGKAIA
ncbi:MAG: hypothetical protein QM775_32950 [Pirellulales bacterium]